MGPLHRGGARNYLLDPYPLAKLRAELLDLDTASMALVFRRAAPEERGHLARQALDEFNRRVLRQRKRDRAWRQGLPEDVGQVVAHLDKLDVSRFETFSRQFPRPDAPLTAFAREALRMQEPQKVLALAAVASGLEFDTEVFAAACLEGLDPFAAGSPLKLAAEPRLQALSLMLGGSPPPLAAPQDLSSLFSGRDISDRDAETRSLVSGFFFHVFCATLEQNETRPVVPSMAGTSQQAWLATALDDLADMAEAVAVAWREDHEPPSMAALYSGLAPTVAPEGSYEVHARYRGFRQAVLEIAIDLQMLGIAVAPASLIDDADIEAAAQSPLWLDQSWLHAFSSRPLQIHAQSGANAVAARLMKQLDGGISQFAERADLCIRLSVFCAEHGIANEAAAALGRAANGVLGYGWRKDMFGYEVLTSLELLHDHDDPDAAKTLLGLAPIFDQITEFTDGDETDHIRAEFYRLLARYWPERASAAYGHLIQKEEWRYADGLLLALAPGLPPGPRREALLSTFIQPTEVRWLEDAGGDPDAIAALAYVKRYLGSERPPTQPVLQGAKPEPEGASEPNLVPEPVPAVEPELQVEPSDEAPPVPADYPPDKLNEFVEGLENGGFSNRRTGMRDWLEHWDKVGKGLEALRALEASKVEDSTWIFAEVYDVAFLISLRLEGRSAAFVWVVRAHRSNNGWQGLSDVEKNRARLDLVAQNYAGRWREFVEQTAVPADGLSNERWLVLGMSQLVYLLVKVGEIPLAKTIVEKLVTTLRAETAEQPLPPLVWAA